jgi:hypothetical protein
MDRYLLDPVQSDLEEKIVFLSGPRQVGKTTLSMQVLASSSPEEPVYLNWDRAEHRKTIRDLSWSRAGRVAVLDEVHKYARWKSLIKGFHDTEGKVQRLLVTGSGTLEAYRKGGDSLAGRYHGLRLHPLSLGELARAGGLPDGDLLEHPERWSSSTRVPAETLSSLLELGGFPEPFLRGSARQARRWRLGRREQVLRQDVRDLTLIREISLLEPLVDLLAERVSSPLSINSLREDLEVEHKTVSSWIEVLERLQVVFRVRPYAGSLARALRKESKVYFWDWSEAPAGGPRFENLVASHLLKLCHFLEDVEGRRIDLRYVRDREKREVDFLLLRERKPWVLVEAKAGAAPRDRSLGYFQARLKVPHAFQVIGSGDPGRECVPAARWLAALP